MGMGVCPNHSSPKPYITTFSTGAPFSNADGKAICVVGTIGVCSCGHPTVALLGSVLSTATGKGLHRVGDTGVNFGPYTAVTGSSFVTTL